VRPQIGKPRGKVCYIASTFTYQVYGNFSRGRSLTSRSAKGSPTGKPPPTIPTTTRIDGLSTYNFRPRRLGCRLFLAPAAAAELAARLSLLQRCGGLGSAPSAGRYAPHRLARSQCGIAYDGRHRPRPARQGCEILASLQGGVMTGHASGVPHRAHARCAAELHREWRRLMYLGRTTGFYWRVALSDNVPGAIEVRRTAWRHPHLRRPSRASTITPSTAPMAACGRRSDRPPNLLCGIGFSSPGHVRGRFLPPGAGGARQPPCLGLRGREGRACSAGLRLLRPAVRRASIARPARPSAGSPLKCRGARLVRGPRSARTSSSSTRKRLGFNTTIPGQTLRSLYAPT